MRRIVLALLLVAAGLPALLPAAPAADGPRQVPAATAAAELERPRVFLDAPGLDGEALRAGLGFVAFVGKPGDAEVQVSIALRPGPEGPERYVLEFTGRACFQGEDNVLTYLPPPGEAREATAQALNRVLRLGLVRYAAKTKACRLLSVEFSEKVKPTAVVDPWRFWVFSLGANSFQMGQSTYRNGMFAGSFSATRVTPELKVRASVSMDKGKDEYDIDGETLTSTMEGLFGSGLVVKSLGEHWSAGGYASYESSTYENVLHSVSAAPAVEFNPFPYSESTKRQLRFLYKLQFSSVRYREETIYGKTTESLWQQSLTATYEVKKPWGTISASLEGSHYLHDASKYRLELEAEVSFRIWKGLEFEIDGHGSRIHDQLFLPRAGASLEDVLLQRRQLATGYNFFFSVGLSFTFGSTQSTVVNPRFGDSQGGTRISISM